MKSIVYSLYLLIFCALLFSVGAQELSLEFKGDENFYFESSKSMLDSGDMVTPRYKGIERFQKPILFYWFSVASFKAFGVNWFSARLPSIIFGSLLCVLVFFILNVFFPSTKAGLFSAFFLATAPLYYRYARLALPEMALTFFMSLSLLSFLMAYRNRSNKIYPLIFFISLAFAFLLKGFVGLILPVLIVSIFSFIKKERVISIRQIIFGSILFIVLVAPWFYMVLKSHGGAYLDHVWSREIVQRLGYGQGGNLLVTFVKNFYFYSCALVIKFLPYSIFIPAGLISSRKALSQGDESPEKAAHTFLLIWVFTVFVFFSLVAESRTHYLLVLSPALCCIIGLAFARAAEKEEFVSRAVFKLPYILTLIAVALFSTLFIFSEFITEGRSAPLWKFVLVPMPVILLLGYIGGNRKVIPTGIAVSLAILYLSMSVSQPFGLFKNKMETAAGAIRPIYEKGDRIGIGSHGIIPEELQVFFEDPVEIVKVRYNGDGKPNFSSRGVLLDFLSSKKRIFCVIKRKDYNIFVPAELRENLFILKSYYVWKRRVRLDSELVRSLKSAADHSIRDIVQNEIYVVSNSN